MQSFMIIGQRVPAVEVVTDGHTNLRIYYIGRYSLHWLSVIFCKIFYGFWTIIGFKVKGFYQQWRIAVEDREASKASLSLESLVRCAEGNRLLVDIKISHVTLS